MSCSPSQHRRWPVREHRQSEKAVDIEEKALDIASYKLYYVYQERGRDSRLGAGGASIFSGILLRTFDDSSRNTRRRRRLFRLLNSGREFVLCECAGDALLHEGRKQ
jgi:hypothetical protein